MTNAIDILSPLVSKETLTIFQLLGFNFKRAIGEPLTELIQQMILTNLPPDAELQKMQLEVQLETIKALSNNPELITKLGN